MSANRSGRWQLVLIFAIAIGTPMLSTLVYFLYPPQETTNRGELIGPVSLPGGIVPSNRPTKDAWYMMAMGPADCGLACRQRLCLMRQVRLAHLGKKERIGRLWLVTDTQATPTNLVMEPGCGKDLPAAQVDSLGQVDILSGVDISRIDRDLLDLLPAANEGGTKPKLGYLYLVDPHDNVVMRYPPSVAAKDIVKDLGRLLRLSGRA